MRTPRRRYPPAVGEATSVGQSLLGDGPGSWRLRQLRGVARVAFPWNLFWDQRLVVLSLVRSQIARRHRRSILGWAWNLIQPGSQAVLLFVATKGALRVPGGSGSDLAGFGIFFAAFIIAQGMGEIVNRGPALVTERPAWVKGSLFPLELLAPTAVGVALYRIIPGGLLGVAIVALGNGPAAGLTTLISFVLGLALAIVWGTSLALAFAAVGVYVRDAVLAAPILTLGMIFISPLYLDPAAGGVAGLLVRLNPLTVPMEFILQGLPIVAQSPTEIILGVVGAFVSLWVASALFRRLSGGFADYV